MNYAYCPQSRGLYRSDLNPQFPADAIEISHTQYLELLGQEVELDAEGQPVVAVRRDTQDLIHSRSSAAINHACEAAITSGFQSDALGAPHQYSSQLDDQLNLTGAILRGLDMPYACRDEQGVKAFRLHTAAQLRQVGDDFTLYKLQLLQHANELKQQLDLALEAGDAEAMAQIRWEAVQP